MERVLHGVVHGNTIELTSSAGLTDGAEVEVTVRSAVPSRNWGEGIRRSAGALTDSWSEEDDRILQEIQQDRKRDTRREIPST